MSMTMADEIKRWAAKHKAALAKSYDLQQEFITPYTPEQNGMVEWVGNPHVERAVRAPAPP